MYNPTKGQYSNFNEVIHAPTEVIIYYKIGANNIVSKIIFTDKN